MSSNKTLKIILILLCVVIVALFVAYYFVYIDIKNKNENYQVFLYDLSSQNSKLDYLVSTQKTINDLSGDIYRIDNSIISKDGEVGFIEDLEALARENGLTIEISSLVYDNSVNVASSSISVLKVTAKTKGSWNNNYTFLARLESMPLKIRIDKFGFANVAPETAEKRSSSSNSWQSSFEIDVLKYK